MTESMIHLSIPRWYRWRHCLTPRNALAFIQCVWRLRDLGWLASLYLAWSIAWTVIEDYGVFEGEPLPWCSYRMTFKESKKPAINVTDPKL